MEDFLKSKTSFRSVATAVCFILAALLLFKNVIFVDNQWAALGAAMTGGGIYAAMAADNLGYVLCIAFGLALFAAAVLILIKNERWLFIPFIIIFIMKAVIFYGLLQEKGTDRPTLLIETCALLGFIVVIVGSFLRFRNKNFNSSYKLILTICAIVTITASQFVAMLSCGIDTSLTLAFVLYLMTWIFDADSESSPISNDQRKPFDFKKFKKYLWKALGVLAVGAAVIIVWAIIKPVGLTKIGNMTWSSKADKAMTWNEAVNYCQNLDEGGYTDWKLPNIDQLRTLIQNHPGTQSGGTCPISERSGKLSSNDLTNDCGGKSGSNFSKLGDTDWFWSSSTYVGYTTNYAWSVSFSYGDVINILKTNTYYVRCVRND